MTTKQLQEREAKKMKEYFDILEQCEKLNKGKPQNFAKFTLPEKIAKFSGLDKNINLTQRHKDNDKFVQAFLKKEEKLY